MGERGCGVNAAGSGWLWRRASENPLGVFGATVFVGVVICGVFAPQLAPYDPLETNYAMLVQPPSVQHPFGTDPFGRDMLSRLIYGARTAMLVGLVSSFVGATLG